MDVNSRDNAQKAYNALDLASKNKPKKTDDHDPVLSIFEKLKYLDLTAKESAPAFYSKAQLRKGQFSTAEEKSVEGKPILRQTTKGIDSYSREEIQKKFSLEKNGFEFGTCSSDLEEKLIKYSKLTNSDFLDSLSPDELNLNKKATDKAGHEIKKSTEVMLKARAKSQGRDCDEVITNLFVFRDENPRRESVTRPLNKAHVDFGIDESETADSFKDNIEMRLGRELSDEEYKKIKTKENKIWMPVSPEPTENTIAFWDTQALNEKKDLVTGHINRFVISKILKDRVYHRLNLQNDMKLGYFALFDPYKTPHVAVSVKRPEAVEGEYRRSIEILYIEIILPPELRKELEQRNEKEQ
jgi:hypothetical protein